MLRKFPLLALLCSALLTVQSAQATPLKADFHLYGQTWRSFLAADARLEVEVRYDNVLLADGLLRFNVTTVEKQGLLANATDPGLNTWGTIDEMFSVQFDASVGDVGNLDIRLHAGGNRAVWNFTTEPSAILPGAILDARNGLTMTGLTLANGQPLSAAGIAFGFNPASTLLSAGGSVEAAFTNVEDVLANTSAVVAQNFPLYASAAVSGTIVKLEVNPDPNPFIIDGATARFHTLAGAGGNLSFFAAPGGGQTIPEPTTLALLGLATLAFGAARRRR